MQGTGSNRQEVRDRKQNTGGKVRLPFHSLLPAMLQISVISITNTVYSINNIITLMINIWADYGRQGYYGMTHGVSGSVMVVGSLLWREIAHTPLSKCTEPKSLH